MTWLAWRQSRTEIIVVALILAAILAFIVPTGIDKWSDYRDSGLSACVEADEPCPDLRDNFTRDFDRLGTVTGWFHFIPAIVGSLLAAPIIADIEQRTYRLAWTQSLSRERWFGTKLAVAVAGALLFAVALTVAMTWWYAPLNSSASVAGKDLGASFGFEGILPVAYTLCAFGLALFAGVITRRVPIGVAVGVVVFIAARLTSEFGFRVGLASDVSFEAPAGSLAGNESTRDMERFWQVQAIEGACFLVAAVLLIWLSYRIVRYRL